MRQALAAIAGRRNRLDQRDAALVTSAIPERRPGADTKKQIVEAVVRRPAPRLPRTRGGQQAVELEPALADEIYEHILGLIRIHGRQMEQSPATYTVLDEEARRDTLLGMLNTHYEGRATAEAFNGAGHTDILLRYEANNLFIAECKFWTGAKAFGDAVDQLFGYAGWRDTKLALIIFVREKGLTAIVEKAREVLRGHAQFLEERAAASETEIRARMRWPGDPERHADLNVTSIHTPAG